MNEEDRRRAMPPACAIREEMAWTAVLARDRGRDGDFVYAVRTTGIYCRPSCPARRPHRKNVVFFPDSAVAEAAGFRACLRCRPDSEIGTTTEYRIRKALDYLERHPKRTVTLEWLARHVGLNPSHLQRTFKDMIGISPKDYQLVRRFERLKESLRAHGTVSQAIYRAGFASSRSAYEQARARLGMTPGEYQGGAKGLTIRYATVASPFGRLLVATTETGVCSVSFGDDDRELEEQVESEFPNATLTRDDTVRSRVRETVRYLERSEPGLVVPADLRLTVFQARLRTEFEHVA